MITIEDKCLEQAERKFGGAYLQRILKLEEEYQELKCEFFRNPKQKDLLKDEYADVLYCLNVLIHRDGFSIDELLEYAYQKNEKK